MTEYADSFWAKVQRTGKDQCWEWLATKNKKGYGNYRWRSAHVVSYELLRDAVPPGLVIDHLCRNRACVNPEHLEAVTNLENILRGFGVGVINARKTHCVHGHIFDEANTYRNKGRRMCRACNRDRMRAAYWAARSAKADAAKGD